MPTIVRVRCLLLALFALWLAPAASANAVEGGFTLEGCKSDGNPYSPQGPFICDDGDYTTGNLGKFWDELDNVPYRLTIKSGQQAVSGQVAVVVDYMDAGKPGFDRMSTLTRADSVSSPGCPQLVSVGNQVQGGPLGGTDETLFRNVQYSQAAGLTCTYDFYARLAFGSHLFPGSALHANKAQLTGTFTNGLPNVTTSGVGASDVSIPVNELDAPKVTPSITAVGDADTTWTLSKTPDKSELNFGDVCAAGNDLTQQVKFDVKWTKAAVSGGNVTINVQVKATSFASRDLDVQAKGKVVAAFTGNFYDVLGAKVTLPANAANLTILDQTLVKTVAQVGGVGESVTFDNVTADFFDPDDNGVLLGTTDPQSATTQIVKGSTANSTAIITDKETISALPALLKFSSSQFPSIGDYQSGYVEGTLTKGPVDWVSDTQTGDGTVQFTSNVSLGEPRIIGGLNGPTLFNAANLGASDGFATAQQDVTVKLTSSATVKLDIHKKLTVTGAALPDTGESIKVKFTVEGSGGYSKGFELSFVATDFDAQGVAEKDVSTITNLEPDSYTVTEVGTFLDAGGVETQIAVNDAVSQQRVVDLAPLADGLMTGRCSGTASFNNAYDVAPARAKVIKITDPVNPEGGNGGPWTFTLKGPGLPGNGVTMTDVPNDGAGSDFGVDLKKPGTYSVTETQQTGWDLTSVTPYLQASPQTCTFTVSYPGDGGATKSCTFTNTKRGKVKVIKKVNGSPLTNTAYSFTFEVREGASTSSTGTILSTGTVNSANNGTLTFRKVGETTDFFLIPGQQYQLCETNLGVAWQTSLSTGGFVPNSLFPEQVDNSIVCSNFTALAGVTVTFDVDNTPPPEGDGRTIGYWKNHASCNKVKQVPALDRTLQAAGSPGIFIGLVNLTDTNPDPNVASSCAAAVRLLDKRDNKGTKQASSPLFNLASQLLAAKLNIAATAGSCDMANDAITTGSGLLQSVGFDGTTKPATGYPALTAQQGKIANAQAGLLDDYNNNRLCP